MTVSASPAKYADFVAWQARMLRSEEGERHRRFWREKLAGETLDWAAPSDDDPTDEPIAAYQFAIDAATVRAARALAKQTRTSLFTVMLAAFKALLQRYAGQQALTTGVPYAGRPDQAFAAVQGYFVNLVPIRAELSAGEPFERFLTRLRGDVFDAMEHADFPLAAIAASLGLSGRAALFRAGFGLQNWLQTVNEMPAAPARKGLRFEPIPAICQTGELDLNLEIFERGDACLAFLKYQPGRCASWRAARIAGHYQRLLADAAANPSAPIGDLDLFLEGERRQIAELAIGEKTEPPADFLDLFDAHVAQRPQAPALAFEGQTLSYGELNDRADALARLLSDRGAGPETVIAVALERGPELAAAFLAVLKTGAAYAPLDLDYPPERLRYMVDVTTPLLTVTRRPLAPRLPRRDGALICVDEPPPANALREPLTTRRLPDSAAYVIFTSGSTGQPKATLLPRRGLANIAAVLVRQLGLDDTDRVVQFASCAFDSSVAEMAIALAAGATLIVGSREALRPGPDLQRFLTERAASLLVAPPSALAVMDPDETSSLRAVVVAGEACPKALADAWGGRVRFYNGYGPTETTIGATVGRRRLGKGRPDIGGPLPNYEVHLLDPSMGPAPIGGLGELCIAGPGLARGYLAKPAQTAERFTPHPFAAEPGARVYRSGDLGFWTPDGVIQFHGRRDGQVKIRGYRVELGEIENQLLAHPAVRDAAVIVREDQPGRKTLAAYATSRTAPDPNFAGQLRSFLKQALPDYMVPGRITILDAMPISPNGKIDRKALPAPTETAEGATGGDPLRTETETALAALWREALGVGDIGRRDNFFDIGGDSLLVTRVFSRIPRAFGLTLPMKALFDHPDLASQAAAIDRAAGAARGRREPPFQHGPREGPAPLSYAQRRLWVAQQMDADNASYHVPSLLRMRGPLDALALEKALADIARRHDVLRAAIVLRDGEPFQTAAPAKNRPLPTLDLASAPNPAERLATLARRESRRPFQLALGPPMRAILLRLSPNDHALLLNLHHIVTDGWTVGLLAHELSQLYGAFAHDRPSPLPEPEFQYADFAVWQREWLQGEVFRAQLDYWRNQLKGAPKRPKLPTATPAAQPSGPRAELRELAWPPELTTAVHGLAKREGVTLFTLLSCAFQTLLHALTGETDVVIGTDVANRNRPETEGLMGFFINQLALRLNFADDPSFAQALARARETAVDAFANQDLPFDMLVEALGAATGRGVSPFFRAKLVLQNAPAAPLRLPGLELSPEVLFTGDAKLELQINMWDAGDRLMGNLYYQRDAFQAADIARIERGFETLARHAAQRPETPVSRFADILVESDRQSRQDRLRRHKAKGSIQFKKTKKSARSH